LQVLGTPEAKHRLIEGNVKFAGALFESN